MRAYERESAGFGRCDLWPWRRTVFEVVVLLTGVTAAMAVEVAVGTGGQWEADGRESGEDGLSLEGIICGICVLETLKVPTVQRIRSRHWGPWVGTVDKVTVEEKPRNGWMCGFDCVLRFVVH